MAKKQKTQSGLRRFAGSRMFLIVLLLIAILVAMNFARAYYQDYRLRQEIHSLEDEVSQLEKKKIESIALLDYVTSDAFVEDKARTELNKKQAGEQVIVFESADRNVKTSRGNGDDRVAQLPNPLKWWYYFTE